MKIIANLTRAVSKLEMNPAAKRKALSALVKINNSLLPGAKEPASAPSDLPELDEIKRVARVPTVINDHLLTIFVETLSARPRLIVELGVEQGFSTFVFEKVARLCGAKLVSVDEIDCSGSCRWNQWIFVRSDDLEFAKNFRRWCAEKNIPPAIDVLMIDTDHSYGQTSKEIEHWFGHLAERAKVFFHDSNTKAIFERKDGSLGRARDYQRGVIRALEEYLDKPFNEADDFIDFRKGWLIKHYANCNGFTILERFGPLAGD